jgi:hypothetical protein
VIALQFGLAPHTAILIGALTFFGVVLAATGLTLLVRSFNILFAQCCR